MAKKRILNQHLKAMRQVNMEQGTYTGMERVLLAKLRFNAFIFPRDRLGITLLGHHVVLRAADKSDRLRQMTPYALQSTLLKSILDSRSQLLPVTIQEPITYMTNNGYVLGLTTPNETLEHERELLARRLYQAGGLPYEPITEPLHIQTARSESAYAIQQAAEACFDIPRDIHQEI